MSKSPQVVDRHTLNAICNEAIVYLKAAENSKNNLPIALSKLDEMEAIIRKGEKLARWDQALYAEELGRFRELREDHQKMMKKIKGYHMVGDAI